MAILSKTNSPYHRIPYGDAKFVSCVEQTTIGAQSVVIACHHSIDVPWWYVVEILDVAGRCKSCRTVSSRFEANQVFAEFVDKLNLETSDDQG